MKNENPTLSKPRLVLALWLLLSGLLLIEAPRLMAAGSRLSMERATPAQRIVTRSATPQAEARPVRLEGTLRYSSAQGLMLGRTAIQLTPDTVVQPKVSGLAFHPAQLHGKQVTLFGTQDRFGFTARMVLPARQSLLTPPRDPRVQPSSQDARAGEFTSDSPS